jgi:DNA-binding NarL/FixJ family response regulator
VSDFGSRRGRRLEDYEGNKADVCGDRLLRVVVAADHPSIRVGVATALKADVGLDVVGEASAGADVLSITRSAGPDVVLLGTDSREDDDLVCLSRLRESYPEVKVIVCFGSADLDAIEAVFRLGAAGCILSRIAPTDLAAAVRRVVEAAEYHVLDRERLGEYGEENAERQPAHRVTRGVGVGGRTLPHSDRCESTMPP